MAQMTISNSQKFYSVLGLSSQLIFLTGTKSCLTWVHWPLCKKVHVARIISCQLFPVKGPGLLRSKLRPCDSQTQPKQFSTRSVTCHSCTGQRCENCVSLLGPTCNNHLTKNLYKPQEMYFVFLFQPLLRPWEADFISILQFCWIYFEIHLSFFNLEMPIKNYFSKHATHKAARQCKELKHI